MRKDKFAEHRTGSSKARATNGALVCGVCNRFVVPGVLDASALFCTGHGRGRGRGRRRIDADASALRDAPRLPAERGVRPSW